MPLSPPLHAIDKMKTAGQHFLEELAAFPANSFESRFSNDSAQLGLCAILDRNELTLLYEASFRGSRCQSAFNASFHGDGVGTPEVERQRRSFEVDFMESREIFYASPGWQTLTLRQQVAIEASLLNVFVTEENLAQSQE
jgi:hypothetical protein